MCTLVTYFALSLTTYDASPRSTADGRICKRGRGPCLGAGTSTIISAGTRFPVDHLRTGAIGLASCTRGFRACLKVAMSRALTTLSGKDIIFCPVGVSGGY